MTDDRRDQLQNGICIWNEGGGQFFDHVASLIAKSTDTILSCLVAQHDRKRTQLPGHLLSNRLRHLPLTVSDHLDQSPAELVVAFDGDGLGSHDR